MGFREGFLGERHRGQGERCRVEGGKEHPGRKDSRKQRDKEYHGVCEEISAVTRSLPHVCHVGFEPKFLL